jgi:D-alanyl-D-alanine carboxypeptidase (penicillin-binding protein 5/6)
MILLYEQLEKGQIVSPEACQEMKKHLLACDDNTKLKKLLPLGTKVAHKTGAVSAVRTDSGLIYSPSGPIAVCVLTSENKDQSWQDDNAAQLLCAQLGRLIYDHFNQGSMNDTVTQPQALQVGSVGEMVVALQRTLNHRLKGVSVISVDGDFGPGTQAAVKTFQRQNQLPETGVVDAGTWSRLGPLVGEQEVPEPQVVNAIKLPLAPVDSLYGPPWVSCTAWAIADAQSGVLLAGHAQDQPLDPASTTKIMTALVVLGMAQQSPQLLDQIVTFSSRADQMTGSTADVRAGEQIAVRNLLFGLLLPSGNDAAVALAEHCGAVLVQSASNSVDGYEAFIAKMNATASQLSMQQSKFANPHGLTDPEHKMSAGDLVKLAWEALKHPLMREIVSTRVYGCTVSSVSGYTRNLKWENTNKLLDTQGYLGVKTGTTSAAGACLVSLAQREGQSRLCVVLGSGNSAARYADTRNLIRWSWSHSEGDSRTPSSNGIPLGQ